MIKEGRKKKKEDEFMEWNFNEVGRTEQLDEKCVGQKRRKRNNERWEIGKKEEEEKEMERDEEREME